MGEVKVPVRITNSMDQGMFRRGLITKDQIRSVEVEAAVDTGAVRSVMPVDIMLKLGLKPVKEINARMANGMEQRVELSEPADMEILDRITSELFIVLGDEVLIGQTALEGTDLLVDCTRQRVITHPDHPNSCVIRVR